MTEAQIAAMSGWLTRTTNNDAERAESFVRFAAARGMTTQDVQQYVELTHGDLDFAKLLLNRRAKA